MFSFVGAQEVFWQLIYQGFNYLSQKTHNLKSVSVATGDDITSPITTMFPSTKAFGSSRSFPNIMFPSQSDVDRWYSFGVVSTFSDNTALRPPRWRRETLPSFHGGAGSVIPDLQTHSLVCDGGRRSV